jgi:predicted RNase H-like HicB family nuclease
MGAVVKTYEYPIILEDAGSNWSGHALDVPGVFGVGTTVAECETNVRQGVEAYLQYCKDECLEIPVPTVRIAFVKVAT